MAETEAARKTIITLRVSGDEEREFRLLARATGRSTSAMIRNAVREMAQRLAKGKG